MSTPNAKKKRLGSRRVAPSQSEVPKADEYHLAESSSVAQHHVLEESTKSLNALSYRDDSKTQTQRPPSPEVAFNRRKLGSSRKNTGRQLVNDLETESYLNPGKELVKKTTGIKTFETIQTPRAVEFEQQEEFSRGSNSVSALVKDCQDSTTLFEATTNSPGGVMEVLIPKINYMQAEKPCENETDKSDTQSEEIKENAHPVVQKPNSTDVPDEEPANVHSVAEMESTKRDGTNLFTHDGRLQGNNLENESHVEFVALEGSTPDITSDSLEQNTKVVFSIEQETFSSSKDKLTANEDPCNKSEVIEAWQLDNATNKVHEVDVKPVEWQDMHQNDYSSESFDIGVTEKADTCSGNLGDQTEIEDTHLSELKVKNANVMLMLEDVNFNEKQYKHPTKERHSESLDQENKDNQRYDSKESADDSVSNEHHTKERNLNTITEENKEGDVDKSYFSESTLSSEVNAPFESQLQDSNVSTSKQTDTVFDSIGKGRKMGSSRRNKERHHEKEFKKKVLENISSDETLETIKISETTASVQLTQEQELDVSFSMPHDYFTLVMPGYSTEAQNPTATNITEINLDSLSPEKKDFQEDQNQRDFTVVSDKPVGVELEEVDKSNSTLSEEVRRAYHSDDAVTKVQEEEVKPPQMQEMLQKDFSSENVIDDATENSSVISGDLAQTEISSTYQSQLMVQSADQSAAKLEVSTPDDKQGKYHFLTEENKEGGACDSNDAEVSLQAPPSEVNTPFESQLEDNTVSVDEKSHSDFDRRNKRKMGSRRRNKGRQHEKEFTNEDTIVDEIPETTKMSATETTRPEELLQEHECDIPLSVPYDSAMFTVSTPAYSTEVQNPSAASYPEISLETFTRENENIQEDQNQTVLNVLSDKPAEVEMEEVERDDTLQDEMKHTHHLDDAVTKVQEEEVKPPQMQEMLQKDFSSENVIDDAKENSSGIYGDLAQTEISSTYQSQLMVQSADQSATKLEVSTPDDKQGEYHFLTEENEEGGACDSNDAEVSLQAPPSEVNTPFESQLEDNTVSVNEQSHSDFDRRNKRKMGSRRRNKGWQREKEFTNEDTIVDEIPETTKMSATETTRPEELLQEHECDIPLSVPYDSAMFTVSTPAYSTEVQNPSAASYPEISLETFTRENENIQEDQNQTVLNVLSDKPAEVEMEEVERDDTLQDEMKHIHHLDDAVTKVQEEEVKPAQMQEMLQKDFSSENVIDDAKENSSGIYGDLAQTEISSTYQSQLMVQSADQSATKLEVSTPDDKQGEYHFLTEENEEGGACDSNDAEVSLQAPPSEVNTPFESQLEDNTVSVDEKSHSDFDRRNKRKMGSSRRNKGRQREKEFTNEDTIVDEIPETTKMSATETTRPEELLQEHECDIPLSVPYDSAVFAVSTPAYSTEVQNPSAASYPEISLETFTRENENIQEDQNQTVLNVLSDKPAEVEMEEVERDDTLQDEMKHTHHLDDAVTKVQEEEVKPPQMQEMLQKDFSSENVIDDAKENSSVISGDLAQTEISSTYQSQLMVQSADQSATKLEVSTPDDKQGEYHFLTEENEEGGACDSNDAEVSLQAPPSEVNTPFESQLEDNTVSVDEKSHSDFDRRNKRKMGSSRRNKGRQREKEFTNEDTIVDEIPETTKMSATETTRPKELLQEHECDIPLSAPYDSAMFTVSTPAYSTEVQNPSAASYPEISLETFTRENENIQEDQNQTVLNVLSDKPAEVEMEEVERDDTLQDEMKHIHHLDDAVTKVQEEEVKPAQMQEMLQKDFSSENVIDDAKENSSGIYGDLAQTEISSTYQSQLMVQSADQSAAKLEVSTPDDKQGEYHFLTEENEEGGACDSNDAEVSLQAPPSEVNTPFESQLEDNTVSVDEKSHSDFDRRNKRKMGSSRRNKGRQREKEFTNEDTIVDEIPETTKMSATETTRPEELLQEHECDIPLSVPYDSAVFAVSTPAYSTEVQNPSAASYPEISLETFTRENENIQEDQNQTVLNVLSDKPAEVEMEEVERDDTLQDEMKHTHHLDDAVTKVQEEEVKPPQMQEMLQKDFSSENVIDDATENSSVISGDLAQTEISSTYQSQLMVQSADQSATKLEVSTPDDKQGEYHFLTEENEEGGACDSNDAEVSLQAPPSEVNTPFESQLEDNTVSVDEKSHSDFDRRNKRKMGSRRRNKGRQHEKEFTNEDTIVDEIPETTKMSATETTRPEELLQEHECDIPLSVPYDSAMFTVSTPAYSTEVQNPSAASYPEISLETFTRENENIQEDQNQTVLNVLSDKPAEVEMEEVERDDTLQDEMKHIHHLDDAVTKVQEEEVKPPQMQEMLQKDFSSENVIDDAKENSSGIYGDLAQTEISSTYQSQLMVQSADQSATKLEVSTPDDKQGEYHFLTEENEEGGACDSNDAEVSLQAPPSEVNTPFESQLEDNTVSVDEKSHSDFDRRNKRKMGSSRRNKGRQREKEFTNEDTIVDEIPETTKMSATETTRPEELLQEHECDIPLSVPYDSAVFAVSTPAYSTEVQNPSAASYPEISLETFTRENENIQEDQNQTVLNVLSDKPAEVEMEEVERDDTLQDEMKHTHHLDDAVTKVQEEEVKPPQMQEMLQKDFSSENVIDDATENSSVISGDLAQTEISSTYQSQLMVQSADQSATKLEVSTPDDKQGEYHFLTEENEEGGACDSNDAEVSLQAPPSEVNTPFESQLEDNTVSVDEKSHSDFDRRNKRKMGSSRRNKGRQREKEFTNEDTIVDEIPETTKMSATETTRPEELLQEYECDIPLSVPYDSAMFAVSTPAYSTEVQNPSAANYPEISLETFTRKNENIQEDQSQTVLNVLSDKPAEVEMEEVERGDTLQDEVKDAHYSEDTVTKVQEEEVKPPQMQEMLQKDFSSENVIDDATENSSAITGDLAQTEISSTYQSQLMVQSADQSAAKLEVSTPDDKQGEYHFLTEENKEGGACDSNDAEVSLQAPPSEVNTPFESQLEDNTVSVDEKSHSDFDRRNKRKMGSSRRNKGRQREKEFTNEDTIVDEIPETTKMSATETTRPEELLQEHECDIPLSVPYDSAVFTVSTPAYSTEVQNPSAASYPEISLETFTREGENLQEDQNQTVLNVISDTEVVIGLKEVEKQEDTKLLTQNANLQGNNLLSRATECMITTEITTEKSSLRGSSDVEGRVVQETFLLSKYVLSTNREQHEHCNPDEVTRAQQSDSASVHQTDYISITEREYSHQTPLSETNTSLDFQTQDNSQSITEDHTALSRAGNRKKLGSSRRNKGRQCVNDTDAYQELKNEVVENPTSDEALTTVKMSPSTAKEEQADDLISTEKAMQISSAANEDENTKKLSEEDSFFLQNDMDSSTIVTSDSNSCSNNDGFLNSNQDVNEENKLVEETEDLDQLTGCDTVTKHLMQSPQASVCNVASDMQHISYHDGIISSCSVDVLDKEEALQVQNATTLSSDKDLLGQQIEDMSTSNKVVSTAKEPALHASDGMAICTAMHASNNQLEQTQSGNRSNLQINPKQKRRKMGSTRRTQLNRKNEEETDNTDETKESEFNAEIDMRNLDKMDAGELLLTIDVSENETAQPLFSAVHKQQETDEATSVPSSTESNVTPVKDFKAPLPKQSTSLSEETISPVTCAKVGDVREDIVELPQLDDCTSSEMQITTVVVGRSRRSINQLLPPNTDPASDTGITEGSLESSTEARQTTQSDTERPGSIKVIQDQDTNEKKSNDFNDEALDKNPEMKNSSPNLNSTNRRRKMGSSRKNLGSRNKEDLHQQQEVDNEAKEMGTNVADTESFPGITAELQLHIEPKGSDCEQAKEKVFETVEISPPGQSQVKSLAEQTAEERPDSQGQLVEKEHRLTANYLLSTSPNNDVVSESASGGRKRKMGSSRKTRGHQRTEDQTAEGAIIDDQNGRDAKISEAEESDKKPSSGISKSGEHAKAVSEKTSAKPCNAETFLGQESQTLSLVGNPGGTDLKSKRYDVVMIGDSSVGKTSFMKRAQSGKFSLDLPASIGLDSLIWPVVVDGKPLVLQLWDTAGQERFHSITKQVFHKAQAFLLMYDITSTKSFSAVSYWANCIQESAAENVIVLLLGNKNDCSQRQVKTHQGEILAKEYDFEFMECSAATGENVIQSLEIVARKLSQRIDTREEATVLHKEPEQKKSSRCC